MGHLHYGSETFPLEDRTLFHLQVVTGLKLRRREPFFVFWRPGHETGEGRHALWIDNGVPIHFEYAGGRTPSVNREWIEHLVSAANSSGGLNLADDRNAELARP
ncbi:MULTISPECIES: hypothetical protein [unclassified Rathayibacter]|uniref:DUF7882 family protein n=1 Tax=unclassified Rathayibacter TaxID=2609250 RepID=UPI001044A2E1|nr:MULTISPECIES: hypothetical protein [unclassified Rathayibacter]TCL79539.1 hypothetical protein EDF49_111175 [Rathayibacter sp. PhB192]TCM25192.1 hypothetical protein EDF43_11120 [Rathayibacter sp. PhB179]